MALADYLSLSVFLLYPAVAIAMAGVAVILLVADPRRNWNRILALFSVLIALNFVAQATMFQRLPLSDSTLAAWVRIGAVTLIMDPAVLAYFVSIFPRRAPLARSWVGPAVLGAVTLVFLFFEFQRGSVSEFWRRPRLSDPVAPLFFLWVIALYLYAVVRVVGSYVSEPSRIMSRQVGYLALGLMIVLIPRIAIVPWETGFLRIAANQFEGHIPNLLLLASYPLVLWGIFAALILWNRTRARGMPLDKAREYRRILIIVAAALGFFNVFVTLNMLHSMYWVRLWEATGGPGAAVQLLFILVGHVGIAYGLRWVLFAFIVFIGIVRFQVLGVHPHAVRTTLLGAGLLFTALAMGLVSQATGPWLGGMLATAGGAAGALLIYKQSRRMRAPPAAGYLRRRALDAYASTLAATLATGEPSSKDRARLDETRKRLGVTRREHDVLLEVARSERAGGTRPTLLGRYPLVRTLGAGSYATVHLAQDPSDSRLIAIKTYKAQHSGAEELRAARRELEVARHVSHPNLLAIDDVVQTPQGMAVVMEFAAGGSLRERLREEGPLAAPEGRRIVLEILEGLDALHDTGLVHGDLKPENILFDADGRVKLADFGSAGRPRHAQKKRTGTVVAPGPGTPQYLAPEVSDGRSASIRSDLYAVGVIAVELVTGEPPADPQATRTRSLTQPGIPATWVPILVTALAQIPASRQESAREFRMAIERAPIDAHAPRREPASRPEPNGDTLGA